MSKKIAIIPARSGSKGLKDKNISLLAGKPLMAYTIQAAIESELFDTIHVSTDSKRYAKVAEEYGAETPFLRSEENSGDTASTWDAVREVILKYQKLGQEFDYAFLLQPTSPLRTGKDVKEAFDVYVENHASTVTSVSEAPVAVQNCFRLNGSLRMTEYSRSPYKYLRRQELDTYYLENGAIYIFRPVDIFNPKFDFYNENCFAYIMTRANSIDIDSEIDFKLVELYLMNCE